MDGQHVESDMFEVAINSIETLLKTIKKSTSEHAVQVGQVEKQEIGVHTRHLVTTLWTSARRQKSLNICLQRSRVNRESQCVEQVYSSVPELYVGRKPTRARDQPLIQDLKICAMPLVTKLRPTKDKKKRFQAFMRELRLRTIRCNQDKVPLELQQETSAHDLSVPLSQDSSLKHSHAESNSFFRSVCKRQAIQMDEELLNEQSNQKRSRH
nr:uncharacterized protein LOC129432628 [Misgurnus anguillicaudatus]